MSGSEDDPELFAAEYALGSLDLAQMRDAEALAARDPAFAEAVARWDRRLVPLARLVSPVQPPAALWMRLALATGITGGLPRRRSPWAVATAVSLALAASLALVAFLPRPPTPSPQAARFVAALAPLASPARFVAVSRPDGTLDVTNVAGAAPPSGRSFELWALPEGASAPVPLGVLPPSGLTLNPSTRPSAQEQLLISDEPAGGSPTGAPTGAVLFGGRLVSVSPAALTHQ